MDHGIEVEPYPQELQKEIERLNADFIAYAESRRLEEENKATKDYKEETERAVHTMDMKSLDQKLMARFLKAANVTDNEQEVFLRNMNLAELDNDVVRPTGLGLLLFGKKPQSVYPNAVIKTTLKRNGKAVETKTIEGRIPAQLDEANKWYKEHIPSYINRDDAERKKVYEYPLDVIRELICNAVVHRDYSLMGAPVYFEINDKSIVIKSPGLPEPPVTLEHIVSFSASSFSRNPVIMYVLDKLDYAEQRGLGFETVKDLPAKNLPLPKVQYNAPYIEFILPLSMEVAETMYGDLSEKEIKVLEYIRINEPVTRSDIETLLGIDNKKAVRILNKLIDKGVIISQGKSRGVTYSVSGQFSGQSVSKN